MLLASDSGGRSQTKHFLAGFLSRGKVGKDVLKNSYRATAMRCVPATSVDMGRSISCYFLAISLLVPRLLGRLRLISLRHRTHHVGHDVFISASSQAISHKKSDRLGSMPPDKPSIDIHRAYFSKAACVITLWPYKTRTQQ